eukprot:gnl/MRDRNA2_/MRDRNA2_16767_c0_seq1.p1 gnl/MRDRNA2_/MRDRNA2_16767_c0~~gnl/MRDRNA2_/MRDRNA2_16767_c0_seq1.p1  ORF type:complete len:605 (-),score=67.91 gnl/MRDRNA2_/MRDRNA2_16767_c0_seq1:267-2000(-)
MSSTNKLLLTESGDCGSASASPVSIAGLTNPQQVIDPGVASASVGVYMLSSSVSIAPATGFRICWGVSPSGVSPIFFPMEIFYPQPHPPLTFFPNRIGAMSLVHLAAERNGKHRALVVYGDTTRLEARTNAWGAHDARSDHDCCNNSGFGISQVLEIGYSDSAVVVPSSGHMFHDRPSDEFFATPLSVRGAREQGLQCGESCGDEFTSVPTDYAFLVAYRDTANPERLTGAATLLKVLPDGPPWARSWAARQVEQHLYAHPPKSIRDQLLEARQCETSDPTALCSLFNRQKTQSTRSVALSPTQVLITFVDHDTHSGTAVAISVSHHLPDRFDFAVGLKAVFNAGKTSSCDSARLSDTTAIVAYASDDTDEVFASVLVVNNASGAITVGQPRLLGYANMTHPLIPTSIVNLTEPVASDENVSSVDTTWYAPPHQRISVCGLSSSRALVVYAPVDGPGEVVLVTVSGSTAIRAVSTEFTSTGMDDVNIVALGDTKKALVVFRDDADEGAGKAQEIDVFDDYNGATYKIGLGSLVTFSATRLENIASVMLNKTAVLIAYRIMDESESGRTVLFNVPFTR